MICHKLFCLAIVIVIPPSIRFLNAMRNSAVEWLILLPKGRWGVVALPTEFTLYFLPDALIFILLVWRDPLGLGHASRRPDKSDNDRRKTEPELHNSILSQ